MAKKGGTFIGNLIAKTANSLTGGLLGAKRTAALASGDLASINPNAKQTGKMLASVQSVTSEPTGTFAGQPATKTAETIRMANPLDEVVVRPDTPIMSAATLRAQNTSAKAGAIIRPFLREATADATVGADNRTLLIIGGGLAAILFAILATKR